MSSFKVAKYTKLVISYQEFYISSDKYRNLGITRQDGRCCDR